MIAPHSTTHCNTMVEDHSHKVTFRKNNASDHHLNMLHRLSLHSFFFYKNKVYKNVKA